MQAVVKNPDVVGVSPFIRSQVLVKTEPEAGNPAFPPRS